MYLDENSVRGLVGNSEIRESAHREHEITNLKARVQELEFDCAELQKVNSEQSERIKKLSNRSTRGFVPRKQHNKRKSD